MREALAGFGVDAAVRRHGRGLLTPVVFCALDPPEDPPLLFYRLPVAPDLTLDQGRRPVGPRARRPAALGDRHRRLDASPARQTQLDMLAHRGRPDAADRALDRARPGLAADVLAVAAGRPPRVRADARARRPSWWATGPRSRWPSARRDPEEAARRLLDHGVELALVKKGAEGVLVATRDAMTPSRPQLVDVVCGLGAGDAFGGALVHGLLSGWDPVRIAEYGNAAGAIVVAQLACADAMPTLDELEAMVAGRWQSRHDRTRAPAAPHVQDHAPGRSPMMPQQISDEQWRELLETRATRPEAVAEAYASRKRPEGLLPSAARSSSWRPTTRPAARWPPAATRWRWPTGAACSSG